MIDIRGLSKAAVLAALYNRAKVQDPEFPAGVAMPMEETTAQLILDVLPTGSLYVDYLYGRVIKVDFSSGTEFDERLYDRDNGHGAAAQAIAKLRRRRAEALDGLSVEELIYVFTVRHEGKLVIDAVTEDNTGRVLQVTAHSADDKHSRHLMIAHNSTPTGYEVDVFRRCLAAVIKDVVFLMEG